MGSYVLRSLRGGDHVTGGTLSRFYGWHVAILPAITTTILLIHLALVQVKGMSVPAAAADEAERAAALDEAMAEIFETCCRGVGLPEAHAVG